ncbi:MAG: Asp-tRNA(Asn)/Glu-tRNA(Gln) amidotransferase subunit GatA [Rickettsiales bacterium]
MTDLTTYTVAKARDAIQKKEISSVEITKAYLDAIEKKNGTMNAYITVTPELALEQAKKSDERISKGEARPLEGVPLGIKDLFCTNGVLTTAASHILDGFKPPYESTVTQNLYNAGTVMLGKTNLDEFAMGSANLTSYYGKVVSPWKSKTHPTKEYVPGGSSGGSAAAVAGDLCTASLGTDTGGSIRQPAAFSGIVGFKPTYGRCSRWGIIAFASSLDQAGPITKTVEDAGLLFQYMAGHDPKDSTSSTKPVPDVLRAMNGNIKGLKIGIPNEYRADGMDPEIERLWQKGADTLKQLGAEIVPVSLPHTKDALATYYIIAPAECSSNLSRYDGVRFGLRVADKGDSIEKLYEKTRAAGFGKEVKRRIMIGTYVLSAGYYDAYYKKAQSLRGLIIRDFRQAFEKVDVLLTPTTPSAAFAIGEEPKDPVTMYLNDVFTVPASMAGLPGISLPAGLSKDGLPLGLQLLANSFEEEKLFQVAGALEQALGFTAKP